MYALVFHLRILKFTDSLSSARSFGVVGEEPRQDVGGDQ